MSGYRIDDKQFGKRLLDPGLYIVATPIGNLKDITIRALETLSGADAIACEDTRVSGKLLARYDIKVPLIAYHEHNRIVAGAKILALLDEGKTVAQISDAGTPVISDPGNQLINEARASGHHVYAIPGASAAITGLITSGLDAETWSFCGFLPNKQQERRKKLEALKSLPGSLIFFESPNRLDASLADMADVLGNRAAAVCRELTKMHEETITENLKELAARFHQKQVKGEIVIVLGPDTQQADIDIDGLLNDLAETMSPSRAASEAAELTGISKRKLYQRGLELAKGRK